jgi:transcriptional antiterminator RfaH
VVATQPSRERLAAAHLRNQDFEVFLPFRWKAVRSHRRIGSALAPLFTGYLFARLAENPAVWRSVNGTIGVRGLIMAGERPQGAPVGFVEALQRAVAEDGAISFRSALQVGDRVSVLTGPFADRIGELVDMDDRGRVAVLLDVLSTRVPVRTNVANLMPA